MNPDDYVGTCFLNMSQISVAGDAGMSSLIPPSLIPLHPFLSTCSPFPHPSLNLTFLLLVILLTEPLATPVFVFPEWYKWKDQKLSGGAAIIV